MDGLFGTSAIVTGGSSGIGQAIATRPGHDGVDVAIDGVVNSAIDDAINGVGPLDGALATRDAIDAGVQRCVAEVDACSQPSRAVVVEADVSDEAAVEAMYEQVWDEFGTVDLPVDAGIQLADHLAQRLA